MKTPPKRTDPIPPSGITKGNIPFTNLTESGGAIVMPWSAPIQKEKAAPKKGSSPGKKGGAVR